MAVSLPTGSAAQSQGGSLLLEDEEQQNARLVSVDQVRSSNFPTNLKCIQGRLPYDKLLCISESHIFLYPPGVFALNASDEDPRKFCP